MGINSLFRPVLARIGVRGSCVLNCSFSTSPFLMFQIGATNLSLRILAQTITMWKGLFNTKELSLNKYVKSLSFYQVIELF